MKITVNKTTNKNKAVTYPRLIKITAVENSVLLQLDSSTILRLLPTVKSMPYTVDLKYFDTTYELYDGSITLEND